MQLGKNHPLLLPGTLFLRKYVTEALPPPLPSLDLTKAIVTFPMYGNDTKPDCTGAACCHLIETQSTYGEGVERIPLESDAEALWLGANGNNQYEGAYEESILRYWATHPVCGITPLGYAAMNWQHTEHVKSAMSLFRGLLIGLALPQSAEAQIGDVWDVVQGPSAVPNSWGGHAVNLAAYDAQGLTCVTWGALQKMTWAFFNTYCDECWSVLPSDFKGALGIDFAALQADLKLVATS